MGRVLRALLALVALVLIVAGVATATYVGSDDTVFNKSAEVESGGRPVVTVPDLFTYDGLRLTVRASAPGGVFLGTANGVDIADYTKDVSVFEVVRVERDGVSGQLVDHEEQWLPAKPAALDIWTVHAAGDGTQELALDVDGDAPPRFVVMPTDAKAPVTLSFGATIDGLFMTALVLALVGVVLLLLVIGWSRLARRRRRRSAPGVAAERTSYSSVAQRLALPVVLLGMVGATGGCASLPEKVAYQPPTKVALTDDQAAALWQSYDKRNNAAIAAANPPTYDGSAWQEADTGPVLDHDVFATMYDDLTRAKDRSEPGKHLPGAVYSGSFTAYPMWAMTTSTTSDGKRSDVVFNLVTRESSVDPWLLHSNVAVPAKDLPKAVDGSVPDEVSKRADLLGRSLMTYWRTEKTPTDQTIDAEITEPLEIAHKDERDSWIKDDLITSEYFGDGDGRPRIVAVDAGYLAVTSFTLTTTLKAKAGHTITWNPPYDHLNSDLGSMTLVRKGVMITLTFLPADGGKAKILGSAFGQILANSG